MNDYRRVKRFGNDQGNPTLEQFDTVVQDLLANGCTILGSYVYKRILLGILPNDIDVTGNFDGVKELPPGIKVDYLTERFLGVFWRYRRPSFIDSVALTKEGLVPAHTKVTQAQVDFIVKNIQAGFYCPWSDMRSKDVEFFQKSLKKLPRQECEAMGFFNHRIIQSSRAY